MDTLIRSLQSYLIHSRVASKTKLDPPRKKPQCAKLEYICILRFEAFARLSAITSGCFVLKRHLSWGFFLCSTPIHIPYTDLFSGSSIAISGLQKETAETCPTLQPILNQSSLIGGRLELWECNNLELHIRASKRAVVSHI